MFDTLCTLPLPSEVFAQALHPTEPILAVGLSAGHVHSYRLPATDEGNGFGKLVTQWRTRRHKGSCRSLSYSTDGEVLYSAGTDGIVKAAATSTGQVLAKIAVPLDAASGDADQPALLHVLNPQTLLVATDSSALHLYDLRTSPTPFRHEQRPQQTHHPHDDYISSITSLRPSDSSTSGFSKQWVTTGATTLAVTDLRRGVLVRSDDQEDELLCAALVTGLPVRKRGRGAGGEKIVVGGAGGVLTLWEKGRWADQTERIIIDRSAGDSESLDAVAVLPDDMPRLGGKHVAVGVASGAVKIVDLARNQVVATLTHDDLDGVVALAFDTGKRLLSGGGQTIKIWGRREAADDDEDDDEDDEEENEDDENEDEDAEHEDENGNPGVNARKRARPLSVNGHGSTSHDAKPIANRDSDYDNDDLDDGDALNSKNTLPAARSMAGMVSFWSECSARTNEPAARWAAWLSLLNWRFEKRMNSSPGSLFGARATTSLAAPTLATRDSKDPAPDRFWEQRRHELYGAAGMAGLWGLSRLTPGKPASRPSVGQEPARPPPTRPDGTFAPLRSGKDAKVLVESYFPDNAGWAAWRGCMQSEVIRKYGVLMTGLVTDYLRNNVDDSNREYLNWYTSFCIQKVLKAQLVKQKGAMGTMTKPETDGGTRRSKKHQFTITALRDLAALKKVVTGPGLMKEWSQLEHSPAGKLLQRVE
ncbi:MAG: WD domain repeat-containing protein 55 [Phylliscum demangeonii]|nr:MAG: WD domain repeat-containing protein 55 [Phylliscum demangeonii]